MTALGCVLLALNPSEVPNGGPGLVRFSDKGMRVGNMVITTTGAAMALLVVVLTRAFAVQLTNSSGLSRVVVGITGDVLFVAGLVLLVALHVGHKEAGAAASAQNTYDDRAFGYIRQYY